MSKSKKKKGSRFLDFFKGLIPLFIFFALCTNIVVVYLFEKSRVPQVIYSVERVSSPTNSVLSFNASSSANSSALTNSSSFVEDRAVKASSVSNTVSLTCYYDYILIGGVRVVKMWDRYYNEGSKTSYGRIDTIFPDRILLADGSWIVNKKWLDGFRSSSPASPDSIVSPASAVVGSSSNPKPVLKKRRVL